MDTQNQHKEHWLNLIIDRLTGTISEDSDLCLQEWIHASDENSRYFKNMELLWHSMEVVHEGEQYDSDRAFLLFKQRIETENTINTRKSFTLQNVLSYAAILISFFTLNCLIHQYYIHPSDQNILRLSEIAVPNGSKTKLTLQDGTKVWLNAGSKIQYDSDFGKKNRLLKLSGEAYLEVAKDENCPFIVDAGEIKVKVLGTCFNVRAYKDNEEIKVALLRGSVEMETNNGDMLRLVPKDIAHFNTQTKETGICHNTGCSQNCIGWIDNKFIFNGESFEQITKILERTFNVKINIHREPIKKRCFIGDFVNNETIEQIFKVMSSNEKFTYTIKGNIIDVY